MYRNYCCCCFKKNETLISIKTKSSHKDGKILLDYFDSVLGAYFKEHNDSDFICMRCSKALQVAYHFIEMVKEPKKIIILDKLLHKGIQPNFKGKKTSLSYLKKEMAKNKLNFESQLQHQTCQSDKPSNELVPKLKSPKSLQIFMNDSKTDPKLDFKCVFCNKSFEDKHGFLEHHRQQHKEIVPFKCKLCSFNTCYAESLFKHCQKNHGLNSVELDLYHTKKGPKVAGKSLDFEITYCCLLCNFRGYSQANIDEHLLKTHSSNKNNDSFVKKMLNCPSCHRSFATLKAAKIHYSMYHNSTLKQQNKMHNNREYDCDKCGKLFDLKSGLFFHRKICEKRKAVPCNFCNLQFTTVLNYERHLQDKHSVAVEHECEVCGKTFKRSEYLTVHRKRHNERYHQCDLCSKNYISNAELKVHKQRIHSIKHAKLSCAFCGKKFAHSELLRYHENSSHNKRFHKCAYCDFLSHSSSAVKIHQYNHTGKPYKCQLCPKEFSFRKVLRQHCEKHHSVSLSNEEMAKMFKQTFGYTSRFDAFSKQNNTLEIIEISNLELEGELEEFGLTLDDIMEDLFDGEIRKSKEYFS